MRIARTTQMINWMETIQTTFYVYYLLLHVCWALLKYLLRIGTITGLSFGHFFWQPKVSGFAGILRFLANFLEFWENLKLSENFSWNIANLGTPCPKNSFLWKLGHEILKISSILVFWENPWVLVFLLLSFGVFALEF